MRRRLITLLVAGSGPLLAAAPPELIPPAQRPAPAIPPIYHDTSLPPRGPRPTGQVATVFAPQTLVARQPLIGPEQAQSIIGHFKEAYPKLGSPRFLIDVNRRLVNALAATNAVARTGIAVRPADAPAASPTPLADEQTLRDVERLFGRPLRLGGATVTDFRAVEQLPLATNQPPAAASPVPASLQEVADVLVEVLVSSGELTIPTLTGDQTILIPDIQATATRLADSRILGQASSADLTNRLPQAALRNYSTQEITEATAFVLLEDLTP